MASRGNRGDSLVTPTMIWMVLGILVLAVLAIILSQRGITPLNQVLGPIEMRSKDNTCYVGKHLSKSCTPSMIDKDGDCLPDDCDPCIDPDAKAPAKDDREAQAMGSDLFDKNLNRIADACDFEPANEKWTTCTKDANGKCKFLTRHYTSDGKTEIQLASLGTQKETIDDLLIA